MRSTHPNTAVTRLGVLFPLLTLVACATGVHGLPDHPVIGTYELKQRVFDLKSGMRIIVQEDHNAPQVMFRFRVGSGGTSDPAGKEGIAHLVEHLAFRNKPGGGEVELRDLQERMGANRAASTDHDVTEYYTIVHRERLADLMQLEAWRLSHLLDGVTDAMFQVEREVVRNELRLRYETNSMNIPLEIFEQLFPKGHALRTSTVIGNHETLKSIQLDDVRAFVKKHYTPNNITVVIAGDVSADAVQKELGRWPVELLFGPEGPTGAAVAPVARPATLSRPPVPAPVDTKLRKVVAPVLEPNLIIAWSAPAGLRGDKADIISSIASTALNYALVFGIDRKPKDPIESIGASKKRYKDASVFLIMATLRPDADPEQQRVRILDAVSEAWAGKSVKSGGVFTERVKWGLATKILRTSSDFASSGGDVLDYYWQTGVPAAYKQRLEALAGVESSAVKQHVYDYLKRERAVSVFFEPEVDVLAKLGSEGAERTRQLDSSRNVGTHRLGEKADISLAGIGPDTIRKVITPLRLGSLPQIKLPSGLRFVLLPVKDAPVVDLRLMIPGGAATVEPFGMATLAKSISFSTCKDYGNLNPVGGSLFRSNGLWDSMYYVSVLDGNLVNGLAVLSDSVSCRKVREKAHLMLKEPLDEAQERLDRMRKRVQLQAQERFAKELYPNHVYGTSQTEPKVLAGVSFSSMDTFVRSHFRPDRALGIIIGNVDEARVRPMIETYFSRWQGGGGTASNPAPPAPRDRRAIIVFDRPGATQSSFSFGCRLPDLTAESFPAHALVGHIVGEDLRAVREEWGATYALYATLQTYPSTVASLVAGGAVETARTAEAIKRLLDNLADIATNGPAIKPFTLKRWDMAIEWNNTVTSNEGRAGLVIAAEKYGLGTQMWDNYGENLANTSRQQVADLVKSCTGKEVVVVVGDRTILEPAFTALGLAITE